MTEIGYQHGIVAGMNGLRDLDPSKTLLKKDAKGKWPSIDTLSDPETGVPLDQWKAWDKMERAFTILVHDHDAAQGGSPPDPPDPPPVQTYKKVAPRATNAEGGSNVQYCMYNLDGSLRPGVVHLGGDHLTDESGAQYTESKQDSSIRDEGYVVPGLPGSRSMDGRSPCKCLEDAGYPGDPTQNTGAWHI
jgi:hypothetical protein